ncbi:hypothetical protein CDN99_24405 [Roseateles aquatilis]|uniref:CzcE family metal-binding protein n=1 Tax=Roseateles aquatilis TaxID=431061 RepID=A0A246IW80_9BURK|nr:CzcE family metal-binding protein [Roseateles aquatilis]OWQ84434.1 hypothetical protein CDN99_24405 [Roseateles aquatilis]
MTRSFAAPSVIAALLLSVGAVSAQAAPTAEPRLANGKSVHGAPAESARPDRVIDLAQVKGGELNIVCGETVQFRSGDKAFNWRFDSVGHRAVDVKDIAPAGFTDRSTWVFVERNDGERN